ncbi:hypothetical protein [Nocardioides ferulae]|uniref:hypothetical protein n=1 Tax=Nocardioides ferulae TaxID=2340821 RepID=UPI000EB0A59E|nr:hypothetical protein [Nocardioides ferulae]
MTSTGAEDPIGRLRDLVAGLERMADQSERELAEDQRERADAAREGRLGEDWRTVQQRIDRGDTTLAAVFSGVDTSPGAVRLQERSRRTIEQWATESVPPAEVVEARRQADAQWERLTRRPTAPPEPGTSP